MVERKVISQSVYVNPGKVGEVRRSRSVDSQLDARSSVRVEETPTTRAYVKHLGPVTPSAPVVKPDSAPVPRDRKNEEGSLMLLLFICLISTVWFMLEESWAEPRKAVLVNVSWTYTARLSKWDWVTEAGWDYPTGPWPVKVGRQEERQKSTKTVVYGETDHCELVEKVEKVFTHSIQQCRDVMDHWTEELEIYSHTEETCFDDGTCEAKEVYQKQASVPVNRRVCESVDRFKDVPHWEYECKKGPLTRTEPVMATWWVYEVQRWTPLHHWVEYNSFTVASIPPAPPTTRYEEEKWQYFIHFEKEKKEVTKERYEDYKTRLGALLDVPR
jgi:hypothetical protein